MESIYRFNSKLFVAIRNEATALKLEPNKAVAIFAHLKKERNGKIKYFAEKAKNNKRLNTVSLLASKTSLSKHILSKYLRIYYNLGLIWREVNGDVCILGNNKIKKYFPSLKLLPVTVGNRFIDTQYSVMNILLHAKRNNQQYQIRKKTNQNEIQSGNLSTPSQLKLYKRLQKSGIGIQDITDKSVLSNQGYSKLLKNDSDNKSKGGYYKKQLIKRGWLKSYRRFKKLERVSLGEFNFRSKYGYLKKGQFWHLGWLMMEDIATMEPYTRQLTKPTSKAIEMDFDFIGWLKDNPTINVNTYKCTSTLLM